MCIVGIGAVFLLFFSFYFFRYKKYLDEEEDSTRENLAILKEGMLILKSIFSLADKMTGENAPDFAIALGVMKERLSIMRLDEFRSDFDHMDVFFSLNNTLNALKDDMVIKVSPSTVSSIIAGKERGEIDEKRIHMNTIEAIRNHMEKLHKIITAEMRTANTYLSAVASERKKV
ncbi:MAG: hypothetical protein HGB03_01460 [Candidatus Yonathbacteria bacterium]|nr:hypothetical protein [Candidatus Yonathbacteria bacterium]NTW47931.1 hypothetical protein [Candidatus Yonathbacteria bacterium]